mmetsp:Transcript_20914/g.52850  ORF Transcript_20914/g.52850 Transcript_20914/m.52850 type:complete len:229 (-) Transcript_20914:1071-1757(-)
MVVGNSVSSQSRIMAVRFGGFGCSGFSSFWPLDWSTTIGAGPLLCRVLGSRSFFPKEVALKLSFTPPRSSRCPATTFVLSASARRFGFADCVCSAPASCLFMALVFAPPNFPDLFENASSAMASSRTSCAKFRAFRSDAVCCGDRLGSALIAFFTLLLNPGFCGFSRCTLLSSCVEYSSSSIMPSIPGSFTGVSSAGSSSVSAVELGGEPTETLLAVTGAAELNTARE